MTSIWDVEQLRALDEVGRQHGVSFKLRGGVAFRLALRAPMDSPVDLFDLVPLTSDVDLMHSGKAKQSEAIGQALMAAVPSAECFRWELSSEEEVSRFSAEQTHANIIPASMIEIGEEVPNGVINHADGLNDIEHRQFRFYRNPQFREAPRDLEVFSALLYLQTLVQAGLDLDAQKQQPGWKNVREIFLTAQHSRQDIYLLEEHTYLRSRLRRLLIATAISYPTRAELLEAAGESELASFVKTALGDLRILEEPAPALFTGSGIAEFLTLIDSDRLTGDTCRLATMNSPWTSPQFFHDGLPEMGQGQSLLLLSPEVTIEPGRTSGHTGSPATPLQAMSHQEFVCLALPENALANLRATHLTVPNLMEENLSAFFLLRESDKLWVPFSVPAVVHKRGPSGETLHIRINSLGLLAAAAAQTAIQAQVALVAWTGKTT